ncbi:hypothetical protein J5N97_020383 [Dioscorea zingiberensis]|uniref:Uncharacterized protein n=1 Tax=Dioscorea zingiberensis TaxID=325984 RepID=A0A9D5HDD7_9LILI|nr:hypothetical protein J5N97_020383 [Dioscorea zingiberensis]
MAFKSSIAPGSPKLSIFLGEGAEVQLPNCTFNTGAARAELRFGTISDSVQFVKRPAPLEDKLIVSRLPSRGRRPNVIVPASKEDTVNEEPTRVSAFNRLSRPKRVVSLAEDDDEPAFTITAKGRESGIFHSSDEDTPKKKSVFSRLTQRKVKIPKQKLDFVSFQGHRNDQRGSFSNSFEPLRLVWKNSTTAELRPQPQENKGCRPPKSYHKGSFSQNLYETYAASKKLRSEKMTPKEFYEKKKRLVSSARRTVFDRLTLARTQTKSSRSKSQPRREVEDEEMSNVDVEIHTVRMVTETRGDPAPEPEQPGVFTRSRRRATDSHSGIGDEGSSQVPLEGQKTGSLPVFRKPASYKEADPPNVEVEDEPAFIYNGDDITRRVQQMERLRQMENREAEYQWLNENMTIMMESMVKMQRQMAALMESQKAQRPRSPNLQPREIPGLVEQGGTSPQPREIPRPGEQEGTSYAPPQAVGLLLWNIDSWMTPFLSTSGITTFQELISQAKKLERTSPKVFSNFQAPRNDREKPKRTEGVKYTATAFNVDKGKGVAESHKPEQAKPPTLGAAGNESKPIPSLKERMNKKYSFRRDKVLKIFKDAVKEGLQLPECKRPEEQNKKDHPNYCPYHRVLGHTIEDCYVFKDWVERQYQEGKITLSKNVLSEQSTEHTRYVTTPSSRGITPVEKSRSGG